MQRRERRLEDGIETLKGNYLLLTPEEAEAIKTYTRGSQIINMLFNTDIETILPRLEHWKIDPKSGMKNLLRHDVIETILNLYSALLKARTYHDSVHQYQDHPYQVHRGSRGKVHSNGFKSFSQKRDLAEAFASSPHESGPGLVFTITLPDDIAFLSYQDLSNYSPDAKTNEEEYLLDPFTQIEPVGVVRGAFMGRPRAHRLVQRDFEYSVDALPDDLAQILSQMAELLQLYAEITEFMRACKRSEAFKRENQKEYDDAVQQSKRIREAYQKVSQEVLNYIEYECSKIKQAYQAQQ